MIARDHIRDEALEPRALAMPLADVTADPRVQRDIDGYWWSGR